MNVYVFMCVCLEREGEIGTGLEGYIQTLNHLLPLAQGCAGWVIWEADIVTQECTRIIGDSTNGVGKTKYLPAKERRWISPP